MVCIAKSGTLSQHLVRDETDRTDGELGGTEEGAERLSQTTGIRFVRSSHRERIPGIWNPMQDLRLTRLPVFARLRRG